VSRQAGDEVVIDFDKRTLIERMQVYFDPLCLTRRCELYLRRPWRDTAGFKSKDVRDELRKIGFKVTNIARYGVSPFRYALVCIG